MDSLYSSLKRCASLAKTMSEKQPKPSSEFRLLHLSQIEKTRKVLKAELKQAVIEDEERKAKEAAAAAKAAKKKKGKKK